MSDELREKIFAGLSKIYSRKQIVANRSLVPQKSGFNLWFFKEIPGNTPTDGCFKKDGRTLLYIGIAGNLYNRILKNHCRGRASNSTLRESLGILLLEESCDPLQRTGEGSEMTFTRDGEKWLNDWMDENAFVCWYKHPAPQKIKKEIINAFSPPLNIKSGTRKFGEELRERRNKILGRA